MKCCYATSRFNKKDRLEEAQEKIKQTNQIGEILSKEMGKCFRSKLFSKFPLNVTDDFLFIFNA